MKDVIVYFGILAIIFFFVILVGFSTGNVLHNRTCKKTCYPNVVVECGNIVTRCATADGGVILRENKK